MQVEVIDVFFLREKLYQEQVKYFQGPDGKLRSMTYEELRELPILDSVIRETLRLHPPIHSIMRYVRDDVPVPATLAAPSKDGIYVVPKGHYVLASPAVSQVDPTVWKDATKWDPARWNDNEGVAAQAFKMYSDENGEKIDYGFGAVSKGTESPYQPFGAGRHRCIGEQVCSISFGIRTTIHVTLSLLTSNSALLSLLSFAISSSASRRFLSTTTMFVFIFICHSSILMVDYRP